MDSDDGIQPGKHIENQTVCESENWRRYEAFVRHHRWPVAAIDQGKNLRSLLEADRGCDFLLSSISITW